MIPEFADKRESELWVVGTGEYEEELNFTIDWGNVVVEELDDNEPSRL